MREKKKQRNGDEGPDQIEEEEEINKRLAAETELKIETAMGMEMKMRALVNDVANRNTKERIGI